ncbi:MAG TPA: zinc-dependent peptidase, partial [Verrucomicrobiae bacterium]|nr:zinc-dependent peptidase [Verrucomicrobiae bacterium]
MWKQRRRKKLLSTPFPPDWRRILEAHVPLYRRLPEADRRELESLAQVFLAEKNFEGCGG